MKRLIRESEELITDISSIKDLLDKEVISILIDLGYVYRPNNNEYTKKKNSDSNIYDLFYALESVGCVVKQKHRQSEIYSRGTSKIYTTPNGVDIVIYGGGGIAVKLAN